MRQINLIKIGIVLGMFIMTTSFTSCNNDDDLEMVYSFTTETHTDMIKLNSTDDATKMANLFFDKKWFMTKTISGDNIEITDAKAKELFNSIVEKANQEFVKMKLNGNCKFTYRCTRKNVTTNTKMEIAKMEWKYLKNK